MEVIGGTGGTREGTISHVQYSIVSKRRRDEGHPLGMDRNGGEWQQIDQWAVSKEADGFVSGAAMLTVTEAETEAKTMREGE